MQTDALKQRYRYLNCLGLFLCGAALLLLASPLVYLPDHTPYYQSFINQLLLLLALIFALAMWHNPGTFGQRVYSLLNLSLVSIGLSIAAYPYISFLLGQDFFDFSAALQCEHPINPMLFSNQPLIQSLHQLYNQALGCQNEITQLSQPGASMLSLMLFSLLLLLTALILKQKPQIRNLFS